MQRALWMAGLASLVLTACSGSGDVAMNETGADPGPAAEQDS
jgi:outer membrane biogenesis lipoprotein LolB